MKSKSNWLVSVYSVHTKRLSPPPTPIPTLLHSPGRVPAEDPDRKFKPSSATVSLKSNGGGRLKPEGEGSLLGITPPSFSSIFGRPRRQRQSKWGSPSSKPKQTKTWS